MKAEQVDTTGRGIWIEGLAVILGLLGLRCSLLGLGSGCLRGGSDGLHLRAHLIDLGSCLLEFVCQLLYLLARLHGFEPGGVPFGL